MAILQSAPWPGQNGLSGPMLAKKLMAVARIATTFVAVALANVTARSREHDSPAPRPAAFPPLHQLDRRKRARARRASGSRCRRAAAEDTPGIERPHRPRRAATAARPRGR